jgi:hypothetical protein
MAEIRYHGLHPVALAKPMTAQAQDSLRYLGEQYALAAFSDGEPFSPPLRAGYRPVPASTACWRGYVCGYEVQNGVLLLYDFQVNHHPAEAQVSQRQQPPDLNGVAAVRRERSLPWHFTDIGLALSYTGGLIIGRGFIRALYAHMGFHPAWKYQHVQELVFEQGRLVETRDASSEMARLRESIKEIQKSDRVTTRDQIEAGIARSFSRNYSR